MLEVGDIISCLGQYNMPNIGRARIVKAEHPAIAIGLTSDVPEHEMLTELGASIKVYADGNHAVRCKYANKAVPVVTGWVDGHAQVEYRRVTKVDTTETT